MRFYIKIFRAICQFKEEGNALLALNENVDVP